MHETSNNNWLSKYMESLGYQEIADGVCLGLSYMSMHAMLLGESEVFINRLRLIKDVFYNKDAVLSTLSKGEISNILAFLDGITLYQTFQSPSVFCYMLDISNIRYINWKHVFDIVKPIMFHKNQINIYNIYRKSGCYQIKELFLFITVLEQCLSELRFNRNFDLNFNNKIPIILRSNKHAIILGYNYINNTWSIVDLGGLLAQSDWLLEMKGLYNKQQIIELISIAFTGLRVFSPQVTINLSLDIYIAGRSKIQGHILKKKFCNAINKDYNWLLINSIIKHKLSVTIVGETWLYSACLAGHYSMVKRLIMSQADINLPAMKTGIAPLLIAAQFGYYDVVCLLVTSKANIDTFSNMGVTPLCIAVCNGYSKMVAFLLQSGASVDCQFGVFKLTPLLLAAQNGYSDVVQLLIHNKAKVNLSDYAGISPLHMAAQNGHNDVVNILVHAKADVNAVDIRGITPLYAACYKKHSVIVNILIQFKANMYQHTTQQKFTPLYVARKNNHQKTISIINQIENNTVEDIVNNMGSLSIGM